MKKKFFILSLLAATNSIVLADDYGYLVFTLTDGSTKSITAEGLSLKFNNGNLTATNGTNTLTLSLTSLKKMEFSYDGTSGIETVERSKGDIDSSSEIYDLQGRRVTKDQMRKGIYIVKDKNRTYKVNIK